jgi:hypothetical protein
VDFSVISSLAYANNLQLQITILLDLVKFTLLVSALDANCVNVWYTFWATVLLISFPILCIFQLETLIANNGKEVEIQVSLLATYLNVSY